MISFFLSFRFGACTGVFCPVRWNRFTCERFLLLWNGCVTVSGVAFLPQCVTLSALFSFSGKRWMNDRIGFRRRGSDLSVQLGRRAYVRHQKSISCHILRSSRFCFLSSRGQLPADWAAWPASCSHLKNNSPKGLGLLNSFLKICPPALYGCVRLCLATLYICLPALGCCGRLCLAQSFVQALVSMLKNTNCLGSTVV